MLSLRASVSRRNPSAGSNAKTRNERTKGGGIGGVSNATGALMSGLAAVVARALGLASSAFFNVCEVPEESSRASMARLLTSGGIVLGGASGSTPVEAKIKNGS